MANVAAVAKATTRERRPSGACSAPNQHAGWAIRARHGYREGFLPNGPQPAYLAAGVENDRALEQAGVLSQRPCTVAAGLSPCNLGYGTLQLGGRAPETARRWCLLHWLDRGTLRQRLAEQQCRRERAASAFEHRHGMRRNPGTGWQQPGIALHRHCLSPAGVALLRGRHAPATARARIARSTSIWHWPL